MKTVFDLVVGSIIGSFLTLMVIVWVLKMEFRGDK